LHFIGDQADTGGIISLLFYGVSTIFAGGHFGADEIYQPSGELIPNSFIEYAASQQSISLRTGCVCNPGGAAALLGIEEDMQKLFPGVTLKDFERRMGRELGVVRLSLGLASNFDDVWRVIQFAKMISQDYSRNILWNQWMESQKSRVGQAL